MSAEATKVCPPGSPRTVAPLGSNAPHGHRLAPGSRHLRGCWGAIVAPGVNEPATVSPHEAHRLAYAAMRALRVLADLNGLRLTGDGDMARQARDAQGVLYACLQPFSDRAGRVADGLRVEGEPVLAPGEKPRPSSLAIKAAAFNAVRDILSRAGDELVGSR